MNKFFTIMFVPEKDSKVKSIRIPSLLFKSFSLIAALIIIMGSIFTYDYWKVLGQISENKHLTLENKLLKEQIQLFQMKMNSLVDNINRIETLEKKLRVLTGLSNVDLTKPIIKDPQIKDEGDQEPAKIKKESTYFQKNRIKFNEMYTSEKFNKFKKLYAEKSAYKLNLSKNFQITKKWSKRVKDSIDFSKNFAIYDYKYETINNELENLEKNINDLDVKLLDKQSFLKSTPSILPTNGWITSYFGPRISPTSGRRRMHEGLDVGAPYGNLIYAPADGIVTFSGSKAGFGRFVQIDHGYGIETIYAHSQKLLVKEGEKVGRGQRIAKVGSTGASTGPHLHYEIRVNGIAVDPLYFILD